MSETAYCPHCGGVIKKSDTFCNNCGASISVAQKPVQPTPTPIPPTQQVVYTQQPLAPATQVVVTPIRQSNGAAVASLVTAIIGFVLQFIPFVSIVSPVLLLVAFITGIIGVTRKHQRGMAIAGLIISLVDVAIFIVIMILFSWLFLPFFYW